MIINKRIIKILCSILVIFTLCGCQLAREDSLETKQDRLIGVFLTKEYLNLFDFDNTGVYNGRVYAELKPEYYTDEETGETHESQQYVFSDLEGLPFFYYNITPPNGYTYTGATAHPVICDSHISVGDNIMIEGTIYVGLKNSGILHINPVYQDANDRVYVESGGGGIFLEGHTEGISYSHSMEEKQTLTENGESTETSFKVTLSVGYKYDSTNINIIQMSSDNTPLDSIDYTPETLPSLLEVSKDAAYLIKESHVETESGNDIVREIITPDETHFISYRLRDDGIFEPVNTNISWGR